MPNYTVATWRNRLAERSDLTTRLVHLTRAADGKHPVQVLVDILVSGSLRGSTTQSGFIVGDTPAVCLQDAPLTAVAQNLLWEQKSRTGTNSTAPPRYSPAGLVFSKTFVFCKGGRPVIYDKTDDAKNYLPATEHWRIVALDLSNSQGIIDWTHEREWRVPRCLDFELGDVTVLVNGSAGYREFVTLARAVNGVDILGSIAGIVTLSSVIV
jgi:hypothetical protein